MTLGRIILFQEIEKSIDTETKSKIQHDKDIIATKLTRVSTFKATTLHNLYVIHRRLVIIKMQEIAKK